MDERGGAGSGKDGHYGEFGYGVFVLVSETCWGWFHF